MSSRLNLSILSYFLFLSIQPSLSNSETVIQAPSSLLKLENIHDKNSFEYQETAYAAALDTVSSGKEALASLDSSRALKLLSLGAKLLPWRGDVISLRNTALETYLKITNDFVAKKDCSEIENRINYLKTIAPDGVLKVQAIPLECKRIADERIKMPDDHVVDNYFKKMFSAAEPMIRKDLEEKYFNDLPSQLSYIVERNKNFPKKDLELLHLKYLFDIWKDFGFNCSGFEIDKDTTSVEDVKVHSNCVRDGRVHRYLTGKSIRSSVVREPSIEAIKDKFTKTAAIVDGLLRVNGGGAYLEIYPKAFARMFRVGIPTSKPLYQKFPEKFLNENDFFIFDVIINDEKGERVLGEAGAEINLHCSNYEACKFYVSGIGLEGVVWLVKEEINESDSRFRGSIFKSDPKKRTLIFSSQKILTNLKLLSFRINLEKTYELYKEVGVFADIGTKKSKWEEIYKKDNNQIVSVHNLDKNALRNKDQVSAKMDDINLDVLDTKPVANTPGFNCEKATNFSEKEICNSTILSQLDLKMNNLYKTGLKSSNGKVIKETQEIFISDREKCLNETCILELYQKRLANILKQNESNSEETKSVKTNSESVSNVTTEFSYNSSDMLVKAVNGNRTVFFLYDTNGDFAVIIIKDASTKKVVNLRYNADEMLREISIDNVGEIKIDYKENGSITKATENGINTKITLHKFFQEALDITMAGQSKGVSGQIFQAVTEDIFKLLAQVQ
jgi:uncharacterized protein